VDAIHAIGRGCGWQDIEATIPEGIQRAVQEGDIGNAVPPTKGAGGWKAVRHHHRAALVDTEDGARLISRQDRSATDTA
jgi:hypothetical protein